MRVIRLLALSAVAALAAVASAAGERAAPAVSNGQIVFQGKRGGHTSVYVVGANGGGLRRLTAKGAFSGEPDWAPDGRRIAFTSSRSGEGTLSIYVMRSDGSGVTRLGFDPGNARDPAWSPNGRQIAFAATGINLMFDDGSIVRRITAELPLRSPTWSPNGTRLAFASGPNERLARPEIYSVRSTGVDLKQLTTGKGGAGAPAWSPDGRRIAFSSGSSDLWLMNPDGSHRKRLTFSAAREDSPAWSPDGRWIVFARGKAGSSLYVIPSSGGRARLLVSIPGVSLDEPDWQALP